MKRSKVNAKLIFRTDFKSVTAGDVSHGGSTSSQTLLIYDKKLLRIRPELKKWRRGFSANYGVESGEDLKELKNFVKHVEVLTKLTRELAPRNLTLVAMGGGSVGDFAGFFASVFKRGVGLIHIPSTWLSALDSSHGGKTALNVGRAKNQIGTFYPAEKVILIQSLLQTQPMARVIDALGELGKIALIDGSPWVGKLEKERRKSKSDLLWAYLRPAIEAKLKVVRRDPFEETGLRQILNLGHTVGHVLEVTQNWTHGYAVAQGVFFALEWSLQKRLLSKMQYARASKLLNEGLGLKKVTRLPKRLTKKAVRALLLLDKKRETSKTDQATLTFLFLRHFGQVNRSSVTIDELLAELRRQGWLGKQASK